MHRRARCEFKINIWQLLHHFLEVAYQSLAFRGRVEECPDGMLVLSKQRRIGGLLCLVFVWLLSVNAVTPLRHIFVSSSFGSPFCFDLVAEKH